MKIGKYSHIWVPILVGIIFVSIGFIWRDSAVSIISNMKNTSIQEILFSYASTMLGFGLATYGIFLSFFPNLKKSLQRSKTLKAVNEYFFVFLIIMVIQVLIALVYMFVDNYILFFINIFLFGITIIMMLYLIRGIRGLYFLIIEDQSSE
ncbi:MAG: hypothetical protein ACP5N1_03440 [Candidatus Woesearchaeota archaeon]